MCYQSNKLPFNLTTVFAAGCHNRSRRTQGIQQMPQLTKPGLMQPNHSSEATPLYDSLLAPLFKSSRPKTIEQQLQDLTEANRNTVLSLVRHGQFVSRMAGYGAELASYSELLQQSYPQVSPYLRALAVEILDKAAPLPEQTEAKPVQRTPREKAADELYENNLVEKQKKPINDDPSWIYKNEL